MSVPQQQMLAQMLAGSGQAPQGGGAAAGAMGGAADMMRKIMLIKALQGQSPQQPSPMAQPNMLGNSMMAQPQIPNAQQMPGGTNA